MRAIVISQKARLQGLFFAIFLSILGCSSIEKNLLFQKNSHAQEQGELKNKKQKPLIDESKVLQDIEKSLDNITLNITKLSDENTKTFEEISSKIKALEATVAKLQIAFENKEGIDKQIVNQDSVTNQLELGREDYQSAFESLKILTALIGSPI